MKTHSAISKLFGIVRVCILLVMAACVGSTPGCSSQPTVTEGMVESFGGLDLPGWEFSSKATAVDGVLHIGPGGSAFHDGKWGDMTLSVRIRRSGEGFIKIRYCVSDSGDYSVLLEPGSVTLVRANVEELATGPALFPPGEWVQVVVMVSGGTHQVTLNGQVVLTATDPNPLQPGGIAFYVQGEAVGEFSDLSVTAGGVAEVPTPVPSRVPSPAPAVPAYQAESWVRLGGPPGGIGYDIRYNFADPNTWYVTDGHAGFFISTDRGVTWQPSNTGIQLLETSVWYPLFSATVDPHDPNIVWAGTQIVGHIYKSTDAGRTWTQMDNGVTPNAGLHFRGFTVDPRSSDIVYAQAEVNADVFLAEGKYTGDLSGVGGRVYRTTDGGRNWAVIWEGASLARYLWIDPTNPDVLYVSTGIWDRDPLLPSAAPPDEETIKNSGLGILKSTDGGQTWTEINRENGLDILYVGSLYMHPQDPQTLLAGTGHSAVAIDGKEAGYGGVYLTTDGGQTWQAVIQGDVIGAVEFCAQDPRIAYAGGWRAFYRSEDGGHTWQKFGDETRQTWGPSGIWPGVPIDMQPDPQDCRRVFLNNYVGGNFLSTDGGETWTMVTQGYTGAQVLEVLVDPTNAVHVYAAGRMAPFVSTDGGQTWQGLSNAELTVSTFPLAMDPSDAQHLLGVFYRAGVPGPMYQSHDGGLNWQKVSHEFQFPPGFKEAEWRMRFLQLAFAASNPRIVYAVSTNSDLSSEISGRLMSETLQGRGIFRSADGGTVWEQANDSMTAALGFSAIAVSPVDPQTVYAASYDAGIFKTTDGGISWAPVNAGLPETLALPDRFAFFRFIVIAPTAPETIYAGGQEGLFRSTDGGASWSQLSAGLDPTMPVADVAIDPTNSQVIYVGTEGGGVLYSADGGATFTRLAQGLEVGLERLRIVSLALSADGTVLYAGTFGHGVYRLGTPPGITP